MLHKIVSAVAVVVAVSAPAHAAVQITVDDIGAVLNESLALPAQSTPGGEPLGSLIESSALINARSGAAAAAATDELSKWAPLLFGFGLFMMFGMRRYA